MIKFPQSADNLRQNAGQLLRFTRALLMKHAAIGLKKRPFESLRCQFFCIARPKRHAQPRRINRLRFHVGRKRLGQPVAALNPRVNGMQRHALQHARKIGPAVDDAKPARPVFQIIQRLGIGLHPIGMIHPQHDGPRRVAGPLRPRTLNLLVQRFNADAVHRPACQLFRAFAFENGGDAGLPHLQSRVGKIFHPHDASVQICPVNWPLD